MSTSVAIVVSVGMICLTVCLVVVIFGFFVKEIVNNILHRVDTLGKNVRINVNKQIGVDVTDTD